MTLNITLDELLEWNAEERAKWLPWLKANPAALNVPLQPGGRFPTVGSLIDHIYLVEVRHILRLRRRTCQRRLVWRRVISTGCSPTPLADVKR